MEMKGAMVSRFPRNMTKEASMVERNRAGRGSPLQIRTKGFRRGRIPSAAMACNTRGALRQEQTHHPRKITVPNAPLKSPTEALDWDDKGEEEEEEEEGQRTQVGLAQILQTRQKRWSLGLPRLAAKQSLRQSECLGVEYTESPPKPSDAER